MIKIHFADPNQRPLWVLEKLFVLGSAADCDLVLPGAESHHARLQSRDNHVILKDLGTQSGTFVNDQRVTQRQLQHGDRVRLGSVEVRVEQPFGAGAPDQPWCLVGVSGWLSGQEFTLGPAAAGLTTIIGRGNHCDVILPNTHLSREHAQFELGPRQLTVRDLDSANGTFLNDRRLSGSGRPAVPGDTLRFDIYNFRLAGPKPPARQEQIDLTATQAPKQWKVAPTSPGNRRLDQRADDSRGAMIAACVVMAVFVGVVIYFIV